LEIPTLGYDKQILGYIMIEDLFLSPLRYAASKNCINIFLIRDLRFSIMRHLFNSLQVLKNFEQKNKSK